MIKKQDVEKKRFRQRTIGEAARSGTSIREFCRQHWLEESQLYWWQHELKASRQESMMRSQGANGQAACFALISEPRVTDAGIELVLGDGHRLRIRNGVDEETLRAALAAVEPSRC